MQSHRKIILPFEGSFAADIDHEDQSLAPQLPHQSLDAATLVQTPKGVARIDRLAAGDRVLTRSGAFEPVTQIDHFHLTNRELHDTPDAAPIRFDPGALPGVPDGPAILISPDCAISWGQGPDGATHFPARAFCDGGLIRWVIPEGGIHYIRLHFETAQQLYIGGLWVSLDQASDAPHETNAAIPVLVHDSCVFRPIRG